MENISLEEKIDFIYKKLKRDEKERKRKLFIKYFVRITLLLIAVYMYFFWINQIITWVKNSIIETINNKKDATVEFVKDKKEKATNFIKEKMKKSSLSEIMNMEWGYKIEKIHCPKKYEFLVGWTGIPSISGKMIIEVKNSINKEFLEKSEEIVRNLKNGIEQGNKKIISENVEENSKLLKMLHEKIYSRKLLELVESAEGLDICAKSSGAGGGDCGIAISFNRNDTEKLLERWESRGIELLYKSEL